MEDNTKNLDQQYSMNEISEAVNRVKENVSNGMAKLSETVADATAGWTTPSRFGRNEAPSFDVPAKVIKADKLRSVLTEITSTYASAVAETYGPGGKDTLIMSPNGVYTTKDGWTVAQNLDLGLEADLNSLGRMVLDVAANVNLKVGDGTTTAIVAADAMNRSMIEFLEDHPDIPMFKIKKALGSCVNCVCNSILRSAHEISTLPDDEMKKAIKNIAMVSTNWNETLANMIADIYEKTRNPYIRVDNSGNDQTYVEYIKGFDMAGGIMLRDYYVTDFATGETVLENPMILMFDYDIPSNVYLQLATLAEVAASQGKPLVIMAPGFQNDFVGAIHAANQKHQQMGLPPVNLFMVQVWTKYQVDKFMYDDMRCILGAQIINKESNQDMSDMLTDLRDMLLTKVEKDAKESDEDFAVRKASIMENRKSMISAAFAFASQFAGTCDKLTVNDKRVVVEKEHQNNQKTIDERIERLKGELDRLIKKCDSLNMILKDVADYRVRISKLACNSAVIRVGGYGDADLKATKDALDDAISACRAAYEYGTVTGGNYHIINIIDQILGCDMSPLEAYFYNMISDAFMSCIYVICGNYYEDNLRNVKCEAYKEEFSEEDLITRINHCIDKDIAYNILTGKPDATMVEPVISSIEILKGCMRLVKLTATTSQYLYRAYNTEELIGAKNL